MYVDKRKLEKKFLKQLTKILDLFDTLEIDYCVIGSYSVTANDVDIQQKDDTIIVVNSDKRKKMLETLNKLGYTLCEINDDEIVVQKETKHGNLNFEFVFAEEEDDEVKFNYDDGSFVFSQDIFDGERQEVWSFSKKGRGNSGYFKPAPLEETYFYLMCIDQDNKENLIQIKKSSKMDFDKFLDILRKNGLL